MNLRESFEEREFQELSPYAAHSRNSRGRDRYEPECDIRTVYQRDRDRILHSKAFRRMKDKTQVFLAAQGDHYRTRLTHTLEVSQIARTIARALNLNEDLTEAIALGHDLGHTPFGHSGEAALNAVYPGGFRHAVEVLEKEGQGLNLTWEVRDGILNHRTAGKPSTLEGQVVRLCDKIAYIHHDMDDAIRAGILSEDDIPITIRVVLGDTCRERLNTLIHDIVEQSRGTEYVRLISLYTYYQEHPEQMSREYRNLIGCGEDKTQVVCDYIAGMTDQYSMHKYEELFVPKAWAVY